MSVLMRIVASAAALAALVFSVGTASACCGGCGCGGYGYGYTAYERVTFLRPVTVYAPVQPTYWVDQGPTYTVPAPTVTGPVPEEIGYAHRGFGWHLGSVFARGG